MRPALAMVACLLLAATDARDALATTGRPIARRQLLVSLLATHRVRNNPTGRTRVVARVNATRPITGERTVLPVLAQRIDRHGRYWLRVRLPGRALGQQSPPGSGWISASRTRLFTTTWHIFVHLNARRVLIYHHGKQIRSYPAIVGKPSTPTPTGQYFVEENIQMLAGQPGAPFALATSDRSNVLQEFDGGPGQIALHGLDNVGGQLGTAESHGCIRLADSDITWLAAHINPGTPVTITP